MLIQYFVLCGNVKGIKDILESPATATNVHLSEYKKHKFWGDREKAIEKLKDAFWYDFIVLKSTNHNESEALKKYDDLLKKYEVAFNTYDIVTPKWDGKS